MLWVLIAFQMVNGTLQMKHLGVFENRENCYYALHEVEPAFNEMQQLVCLPNQVLKEL